MVQRDREVKNAARREYLAQQERKAKAKAKLNRRLATKKAEREDETGELRRQRLAQNVPRTIENTREWVGGGPSAAPYVNKRRKTEQRGEGSDEGEDDEDEDDEDDGFRSEGEGGQGDQDKQDPQEKDAGDARLRPVQVKVGTENSEELVLDMAGLEDLFPQDDDEATAAAEYGHGGQEGEAGPSSRPLGPSPHKPILLTTSPRPHGPTYAFLNELQSLLGGKRYAEVLPRKNKRFELSRVVKWATKRGYGAIIVVGEDLHGEPGACVAVYGRLCKGCIATSCANRCSSTSCLQPP